MTRKCGWRAPTDVAVVGAHRSRSAPEDVLRRGVLLGSRRSIASCRAHIRRGRGGRVALSARTGRTTGRAPAQGPGEVALEPRALSAAAVTATPSRDRRARGAAAHEASSRMRPRRRSESREVDTTAVGDERITESRHACSSGAVGKSSSPESVSASPEAGRGRVGLDCVVDQHDDTTYG